MPIFRIERTVTYTADIEAPTSEIAIAQTKDWSNSDWGYEGDADVDTVSMGKAPAGTRPDFTVDLRGVEHDFDDEDTGGCIYCDERPPATDYDSRGATDG